MTLPEYAAACFPAGRRVLGVRLQPLCLGHALVLHRLGSPLAGDAAGVPQPADLHLAVEVCARPVPYLPSPWRLRWRAARSVGFTGLGRAREESRFLDGVADFRAYWREAHAHVPEYWPDADARDSGVPMLAALVDGLLRLGYPEALALNTPVSKAVYLLAVHAARNGTLRLMTAEEQQLIAAVRAAGGSRITVEQPDAPANPAEVAALLAAQSCLAHG